MLKNPEKWVWSVGFVLSALFLTQCSTDDESADSVIRTAQFCYSCHGDDYLTEIRGPHYPDDVVELHIPEFYVADPAIIFSPRTDPGVIANGDLDRLPGYSNKRLEFDPETDDVDTAKIQGLDTARFGVNVPSHTSQINNPSFHPVSGSGRNGSYQLCNQLAGRYQIDCGCGPGTVCPTGSSVPLIAAAVLSELRVECVDCHVITGSAPNPASPTIPHQLDQTRLLKGAYDTGTLIPGRCFGEGNPVGCVKGDGFDSDPPYNSNDVFFGKFLLCFQCHDRRAFDPDLADGLDRSWTRFFGVSGSLEFAEERDGNLHMYHLRWSGSLCHECHYNVHSNVEAINTIYGDGTGGLLPPDGEDGMNDGVIGTHLIDFAPTVEGTLDLKPRWFFAGDSFRCFVRCHNEVMNACAYLHPFTSSPDARQCAGGDNPGRAG